MKTLLIAILFIVGCGPGNSPDWLCEDCNNRIDEMENEMGVPDDELVLRGERDNYWSATYWYWQAGISYTFVQSGCVCDESTLTFTPVLESSEIETSWKHQSNPYTGQGSYSIAFSKGVLLVRLMLKLTGDPVSEELLAQYEKGIEDTWSTDRFSVPIVVDVVWTVGKN